MNFLMHFYEAWLYAKYSGYRRGKWDWLVKAIAFAFAQIPLVRYDSLSLLHPQLGVNNNAIWAFYSCFATSLRVENRLHVELATSTSKNLTCFKNYSSNT